MLINKINYEIVICIYLWLFIIGKFGLIFGLFGIGLLGFSFNCFLFFELIFEIFLGVIGLGVLGVKGEEVYFFILIDFFFKYFEV